MKKKHALIVGGTGMLGAVSLSLLEQFSTVTLVARKPERLRIPDELLPAVNRLAIDYRSTADLLDALEEASQEHGDITLAVLWVHDTAPEIPLAIAQCNALADGCRLIHVVGSAYADPAKKGTRDGNALATIESIEYSQVVLGFILEGKFSRWLSHEEISSGVLEAISDPQDTYIVGTVDPWSRRP